MAPTLDPEYIKMLSAPAPLEGPRKDVIFSLQKQIDVHILEANRLRYARNSHVAISRLPAELLSNAFLYIVEAGLQEDGTSFATGTFAFLQVCRGWNETAVGFPQLWVRWVPGAFKAWHLFKSRSKDAPLSLTWRDHLQNLMQNILKDAETPRRVRRLDFNGTSEELEDFLGLLDLGSTPIISSIRLRRSQSPSPRNNEEYLTRLFSLPFPKLSELHLDNFLPGPTSLILTTSNLTSLKLKLACDDSSQYTQPQFLQVLEQHPNLQQLDLEAGGLPLVEGSGSPVPIVLSDLVYLRLCGTGSAIAGFVDLVSMSSPLHDVVIHFQRESSSGWCEAPTDVAGNFLTAYYGCEGLDHSRKANHLIVPVSPSRWEHCLVIAESRSASASHPTYNLKLIMENACTDDIIHLFPLKDVCEYATEGSEFYTHYWRKILEKMEDLLYLRLDTMDVEPVLDAFDLCDGGTYIAPKLKSLSCRNVDLLYKTRRKLLEALQERRDYGVGLETLVIQSCRVPTVEYKKDLEDFVEEVVWDDVTEMGSEYTSDNEDGWTDKHAERALWARNKGYV